jgi:hypothetical protein
VAVHDGAPVVWGRERALGGRATAAALAARSPRRPGSGVRNVVLVSGTTSRTKIVNVPDSAAPFVARLRDG